MGRLMVVGLFGATLSVAAAAGGAVTAAESTPAPSLGAPPGAADGLQLNRLLDRLGPDAGAPSKDAVEVAAWIEPTPGAAEVVITLTPTGKAKLVADPGITVTPADPDGGVAWRTPLPHHLVDAGAEYFVEPPTIRLPLGAPEVGPIDLDVEYAYCFVDTICLFGKKRVTATLRPSSGGPLSR